MSQFEEDLRVGEHRDDYRKYTLFFYIRTFFIRTLRLRFDQEFKKMYGTNKNILRLSQILQRSYKKKKTRVYCKTMAVVDAMRELTKGHMYRKPKTIQLTRYKLQMRGIASK